VPFPGGTVCDYSLYAYRTTLAKAGDKLKLHLFPSGSKGFTYAQKESPWESFWRFILRRAPIAVCIPPGASLRLEDVDEMTQHVHDIDETETVRLVQMSMEPDTYRDGLLFENGMRISLQKFEPGLEAIVISTEGRELPTIPTEESLDFSGVCTPSDGPGGRLFYS
jgi:hypothetical protein